MLEFVGLLGESFEGMMPTSRIQYAPFGASRDGGIVCPCCGSDKITQKSVFVSQEKSQQIAYVPSKKSSAANNIDLIRKDEEDLSVSCEHGLAIRFYCEQCSPSNGGAMELVLTPHRGQTLLGWRFTESVTTN